MTFTGEMSAADFGCPSKNIPRKVAPSGLMVALRLVDGKLACLVGWLAPPIEQKPRPIISTAAWQNPNVPSPLSCISVHNPAGFECADGISQKPR